MQPEVKIRKSRFRLRPVANRVWLFLPILLFYSLTANAHLPGLYGKKFVRLSTLSALPVPRQDQLAPPLTSPADSESYQLLLTQMEQQGGPYADTLAQPLAALASMYRKQGNYPGARELYLRALHVIRVNDGLAGQRQVPLLREMLQMYRETEDFKSLDEGYDYLFRLGGSGLPPYDTRRVEAGLEYLGWQREVHCRGFDNSNARLLKLYQLNQRMLQSLSDPDGRNPDWYGKLVMSQLRNLYLVLGQDLEQGRGLSTSDSGEIQPSQISSSDYVEKRIAGLQIDGIRLGQNLLQSLRDTTKAESQVSRASLHLAMGDWYQWNGSTPEAARQYQEVTAILNGAGDSATLEQWLGSPAELPGGDLFCGTEHAGGGADTVVVTAHYTISERGQVRELEVSVSDDSHRSQGKRIARMLRQTHFRPRYITGQPESVEKISREYVLRD